MISRRNFIHSLLYTVLTGSWAVAGATGTLLRKTESGVLSSGLFSDRRAVEKVARSYLGANPEEVDTELLLELLNAPGVDKNKGAQRHHLANLRERDFETGDVLFVDGWMISRTEARLCVLDYNPVNS